MSQQHHDMGKRRRGGVWGGEGARRAGCPFCSVAILLKPPGPPAQASPHRRNVHRLVGPPPGPSFFFSPRGAHRSPAVRVRPTACSLQPHACYLQLADGSGSRPRFVLAVSFCSLQLAVLQLVASAIMVHTLLCASAADARCTNSGDGCGGAGGSAGF